MSTATISRGRRSPGSAKRNDLAMDRAVRATSAASPAAKPGPARKPLPNYMARLLERQPKPMSEEATRALWEHERGDR
jgi:hypothetical protein